MRRAVLAVGLGLLCAEAAIAQERVVAVGDLHGDLGAALQVLHLAGVVDGEAHWSGGSTTLVQTGDTTDRGPDSKAILDLMRRLEQEAREAGGHVVCLLGNHEVMNLQGDWRYVAPGDVEAFGGPEERKAAMALDGHYGAWLASLDVATRIGDTVFVHGGLEPRWASLGLEALNRQARSAIRGGTPKILGPGGPVWSRDLVMGSEVEACEALAQSLSSLGAHRMVVGHTTQRDGRIHSRCQGRLHAIDTGISRHYGSHLAAWQEVEGDARALYPTGPVDLEDPP